MNGNYMSYKKYRDHWIVVRKDGSVYCHCDNPQECKEEIKEAEKESIYT